MPELPEVETVVRGLREPLVGRTVRSMWYDWARLIHSPSPEEFAARIQGQTFRAVSRRQVYSVRTDHDVLIIHRG
jgi:formamidopyrimidine-DNA glycosylase